MARDDDEPDELDGIRSRFGQRVWSTGRVAASAARLAGRKLVGAHDEATDARLGAAIARELDGMKGMAMKVGQILSYFDGVLPEATHEALRALQRGARPVAFDTMRQVVEDAFDGAPLESLFETFERHPVASASIGQVYRARLDGREVAVKVQYPGVQQTFESDFARVRKLARLASLATAVDGLAIADELRERIVEECDYLSEARWQVWFRRALVNHPGIVVPEVYEARTRRTVLTTQWAAGDDFYTFVERADATRRNQAALRLAAVALDSLYRLGVIQADPHPGNFLFDGDTIVLLDFGCVRRFEPDFLQAERALVRIVVEDRRADFDEALLATGLVARPRKFDFERHWQLLCHQYAPYRQPHFHFTRAWLQAGNDFSSPSNPNLRRLAIPPAWIWIQRLLWGLHAVLVRLEAEGDFQSLMRNVVS